MAAEITAESTLLNRELERKHAKAEEVFKQLGGSSAYEDQGDLRCGPE